MDEIKLEDCGCCEINDYFEDPDCEPSCLNCGHSPEEHEFEAVRN